MNTRGAPLQLCIQVMDYDYWFNIAWLQETLLDVYGGTYALRWSDDGCRVERHAEILAGPAPAWALVITDDIPF